MVNSLSVFVEGVVVITKELASFYHFKSLNEAHLTQAFLQRPLGVPGQH